MKKYLEYQDDKSNKFWEIEVTQNSYTLRYGKIGTDGQSKTKSFDSEEAALKDAEKLYNSKIKKGYVEKTSQSVKKVERRFFLTYDESDEGKSLLEKMEKFLSDPKAQEVTKITIGMWTEPFDTSCQDILDFLSDNNSRLPKLRELFVGDMSYEECEISWIIQGDYSKVITAYPDLESLYIKGSQNLKLGVINHKNLQRLTIECGGLDKDIIGNISKSTIPSLQHLELYLGVDDYGFNGSLNDIDPLLKKGLFPNLKYIGLKDSDIADDIAESLDGATILDQIEELDLSLGTLSNKGAEALLNNEKIKNLKKLNLYYHYMSKDMMKKIKGIGITVDVNGQQEEEDDYRYPAVTE